MASRIYRFFPFDSTQGQNDNSPNLPKPSPVPKTGSELILWH